MLNYVNIARLAKTIHRHWHHTLRIVTSLELIVCVPMRRYTVDMPPVEGVTHPQVGWRHWMMRKPVVLGLITVVVVLLFLWPSVGPTRGRTGGGTAPGLRGIKSAQYGKVMCPKS